MYLAVPPGQLQVAARDNNWYQEHHVTALAGFCHSENNTKKKKILYEVTTYLLVNGDTYTEQPWEEKYHYY